MFGNIKIEGNERTIAREYANRIGGDTQLQQIFNALLNDEAEELTQCEQALENMKIAKEACESELDSLQAAYDKLHAQWVEIGGDLL